MITVGFFEDFVKKNEFPLDIIPLTDYKIPHITHNGGRECVTNIILLKDKFIFHTDNCAYSKENTYTLGNLLNFIQQHKIPRSMPIYLDVSMEDNLKQVMGFSYVPGESRLYEFIIHA